MADLRGGSITRIQLGVLALLVLAAIGGGFWIRRYMQVDRCLDAGGRWDYGRSYCEGLAP